jgi:hypothetical protein
MTRRKLAILAILVLALGTVQCVASCTGVTCDQANNVPPCHKHQHTTALRSCAQDFVRPEAGMRSPDLSSVLLTVDSDVSQIPPLTAPISPALITAPLPSSISFLKVLRI